MASKNLMAKSRKAGNAYAVIDGVNGWKWEILKLYKNVENSKKDAYARAFCFVHGFEKEYGDVYLSEIAMAYGDVADFWATLAKAESDMAKAVA